MSMRILLLLILVLARYLVVLTAWLAHIQLPSCRQFQRDRANRARRECDSSNTSSGSFKGGS